MQIEETPIKGCYILQPTIFEDHRGSFFESFNQKQFEVLTGQSTEFVQDNQSKSAKGVLRGLHFQTGEYAQAKLVRVLRGKVQDVVVDLRPNSKTFKQHFSINLSAKNKKQLYVPRGLAHGFLALKENTIFSYKCDNYYKKTHESGIIYSDPELNIKWQLDSNLLIVSEKDSILPTLNNSILP